MEDSVEFEHVSCMHETSMALLCMIAGEQYWIPKSQILDESEVQEYDDSGTLVITEWLAREKQLV